jgi:hypothetical protein
MPNPNDPLPSDAILLRITHLVLAFGTTYHFYAGPDNKWDHYKCSDSCKLEGAFPAVGNAQKYATDAKKVNPKLKVMLSFGGWNMGPGDEGVGHNCYKESHCYDQTDDLAKELANVPCLDGVDFDYEMSEDLVGENSAGREFLLAITDKLKKLKPEFEITHAPQPPYFLEPKVNSAPNPAYGAYSDLLSKSAFSSSIDFVNNQYYNNEEFQIKINNDNIVAQVKYIGSLMNSNKKSMLGVCFYDCNPGYSAADITVMTDLLTQVKKEVPDFGGIMIWANANSKKTPKPHGGVDEIPQWLDELQHIVV